MRWIALAGDMAMTGWTAIHERFRRRHFLKPYVNNTGFFRAALRGSLLGALCLFCLVFGFFFALTAPYLNAQFLFPIGLVAALTIWALPDQKAAPAKSVERMLIAFTVSLLLWPNYLAIALPGLPWITVLRLTSMPMAALFLIGISTSESYRRQIGSTAQAAPLIWQLLAIHAVLQFATLPFSKAIADSLQKAVIQQINWTIVFLAGCYIFRTPGRAERYLMVLVAIAVPVAALTIVEARVQHVLWNGHVPSFLRVDDAAGILQASMRSADGLYRAKANFSTPLGLAEYMAICTPFLIHFAAGRYHWLFRIFCAAMIPVAFYCVQASGSRLGNVGMMISAVLYLLIWGAMRWRHIPRDIIGPAVVIGYPAFAGGLLLLSMFWRRMHVLLFGGGAAKASTDARLRQIEMALPNMIKQPFGHGTAQAGDAMGYASGKFIAIDNYYIATGLGYGVLGLFAFYGMFIAAMTYAARDMYRTNIMRDRQAALLVPLFICFAEFMVIKWVFGQEDNHSLVFIMLAMVSALVWRNARAAARPAVEEAAEILRPALRSVLRPTRQRELA